MQRDDVRDGQKESKNTQRSDEEREQLTTSDTVPAPADLHNQPSSVYKKRDVGSRDNDSGSRTP